MTLSPASFACLLAAALACLPVDAVAEKADRSQPMVVEAERDGVIDLQRRVVVYAGNAVITQGTMVLRADRVEMREMPDGYRAATALGRAGKPASWRQRRDGAGDEVVEGTADRIEFDGRADTLLFVGNGTVRRLRAGTVADEITGATILWDNTSEQFKVTGGNVTPVNPTGRVRAVLSPRAEPASAPTSSAGKPAAPKPGAAPLTPSRVLGEPR